MSKLLSDKVALVTGAGRGIGREIAAAYAHAGARVLVSARTESELEETVRSIRTFGGTAVASIADVTLGEDVGRMVRLAVDHFGKIDILVNNAGIPGPMGAIDEVSEEDWDRTLAVNLKGAFLCCRAVVPIMAAAGGGNIINVSSGAGHPSRKTAVRSLAYQVSKFALEGLTEGLAVQMREHRINVNSLLPGVIATRFHAETPAAWLAAMGGKMGEPAEVVEAALFLATRPPGEFTGQVVRAKEFNAAQRSQ